MHYFGSVKDTERYFDSIGFSMPQHINPAEFILELMNVDFAGQESTAHQRLKYTSGSWTQSAQKRAWTDEIEQVIKGEGSVREDQLPARNFLILLATLVHRSFVKSYRDVIAYGVRIAMYVGLAIMMGTVWLRLDTKQESIVPFTNAIVRTSWNFLIFTNISVLRIGVHEFHGSGIRTKLSRGSSHFDQGAS